MQPLVNRGKTLVCGVDLDEGCERGFYAERMRDVAPIPLSDVAPSEYLYSVVAIDIDEAEAVEAGTEREDADGFAFGFNGEAEARGTNVRAVVIADCDM
ncbi:hypothetical protein Psta_0410 [Pirellula staleyi DSM 6068]|uniref:Uncharacterized protein n=1 Tax=Pirellula staleyi (strain ATCC 27377 / DSM 6068 / ICPB 4128) TaxID=530564 RepID=D2R369_PIRSD|nr:hypothetical protein Psta_0410 [Pirellula staleyi DSM 6068]